MPRKTLSTLITLALASMAAGSTLAESGDADIGEMDRIIVTADPLGDRTADELIQPVSVVAGDELERRRAGSLGEMIDGLPGVANSDFGPGVGRPTVRGLQGSRVQVLEDGLATSDVSGEGADHAIAIDTARAAQIEVFRGPSTLLYGSGAAGGVINVRSNRFSPVVAADHNFDLMASYGFNGDDKQGRVAVEAPAADGFILRGEYNMRRTNDFGIKGFQGIDQQAGNRDKLRISSVETDSAAASGTFHGDWGLFALGISTWDTEYGIPENFDARPRNQGGQSDDFERVFADYDRFDLRAEFNQPLPGFSVARLKMSYTQFEQEEVEFEFDRTPDGGELAEAVVEAAFANDEFDSRFEFVHEPISGWRGVIGLSYNDRDFFADDPRGADRGFYVRPNRTRTTSVFIIEELPTDFGRFEVGLRIERVNSRADDVFGSRVEGVTLADGGFLPLPEVLGSRSFTPFSFSGGAIIDVGPDHHLRAAATRAQRAPSPEQLFAFGRHAAAGTFEVGNPDLKLESYTNLEIGFDRHQGPLRYDLTTFYNRASNFIFLASEDDGTGNPVSVNDIGNRGGEGAAAGCEPGDGGLCRLRNQFVISEQANAEFYGAEFMAALTLVEGPVPVTMRVTGDHVRGKLRDGGNLPRITPTRLGLGFDTSFGDWDASIDYRRVFSQSSTAEAETETDGFNLLGFDLFWRPAAFANTQVFIKGRNLLNEDGRLHQSFFKEEAPILGRGFSTGLRVKF